MWKSPKLPHALLPWASVLFYMQGVYPETEFLIALVSSWHDESVRDGPLGKLVSHLGKTLVKELKPVNGISHFILCGD